MAIYYNKVNLFVLKMYFGAQEIYSKLVIKVSNVYVFMYVYI